MGFSDLARTVQRNNTRLKERVRKRSGFGTKFSFHAHPQEKRSKMELQRLESRMETVEKIRRENRWGIYLIYFVVSILLLWWILSLLGL